MKQQYEKLTVYIECHDNRGKNYQSFQEHNILNPKTLFYIYWTLYKMNDF